MKIESYLTESPLFAVTKAARALDASLDHALKGEGLTFFQGLVLAAIFFEDPAMASPSQLAEAFSTTRGNMSHCLSLIEARGFVRRQVDQDDARVFRIAIKPEGKKCALRLIRTFDGLQNGLERELGVRTVRQTLRTIGRIEALCETLTAKQG